jgi:hypothetical protein
VVGDGHEAPQLLVERAERLVHQQHLGLEHQRPGDRHALAHAPRQGVGVGRGELGQAQPLERLGDQGVALGPGPPALDVEPEPDVPLDGLPGTHAVVLEDHAEQRLLGVGLAAGVEEALEARGDDACGSTGAPGQPALTASTITRC